MRGSLPVLTIAFILQHICTVLKTNCNVTAWNTVLLEKVTLSQLVKNPGILRNFWYNISAGRQQHRRIVPKVVYTVKSAPEDGRVCRPKHVEEIQIDQ